MSSNPASDVPAVVSEPAAAGEGAASSSKISMEQIAAHGTHDDFWCLISGKVYDTTSFMDEHPGGDEVILAEAGKDATEAFEDVGHSEEARKILQTLYIGEFDGVIASKVNKKHVPGSKPVSPSRQSTNYAFLFPLALFVAYLAWRLTLAQ